jgi:hypothetical protein
MAIADTRTTTVDMEPEVSLKQVFSPGLFFMVHVKNAPVSFALGAARTPELRKVTVTDNTGTTTETKESAWRFGVSVGLDLVLLP